MPAAPEIRAALESCYFSAAEARVKQRRLAELRAASAAIDELAGSYIADISRLARAATEVKSLIDSLRDPRHRVLLELRYIDFMPWDDIAREMGYDKRYLYKLHNAAIEFLSDEFVIKNRH